MTLVSVEFCSHSELPAESKEYYNTIKLAMWTAEIQEDFKRIEEYLSIVQLDKCGIPDDELTNVTVLADDLHKELMVLSFERLDSLIGHNLLEGDSVISMKGLPYDGYKRIVKKDRISLPNHATTFTNKLAEIEDMAKNLKSQLKTLRIKIGKCQRKHENCAEVLQSKDIEARTKIINEALKYYQYSDEDICQQKQKISHFIEKHKGSIQEDQHNAFFVDLQIGLLKRLEYKILECEELPNTTRKSELGQNVHSAWSRLHRVYVRNYIDTVYNKHRAILTGCEAEYIKDQVEKWGYGITVDSAWVAEQKNETGDEVPFARRGCTLPCSPDYDTLAKVLDNLACSGCLDPKAINYCRGATRSAPCQYRFCTDSRYLEATVEEIRKIFPKYDPVRDKLIPDSTICRTLIVGCTNSHCNNFVPTAIKDDGSCNCCCGDTSAVNYVPHCEDYNNAVCHWRGCTDTCAVNYDPRARVNDGSCICEPMDEAYIMQQILGLSVHIESKIRPPQELEMDFERLFRSKDHKAKNIASSFSFSRQDADLNITANIQLSGRADNIDLGAYLYPPIYEVIDSLIEFLSRESKDIQSVYSNLNGHIIGEADNTPIRSKGILFSYTGVTPNEVESFEVERGFNTDAENLMQYSGAFRLSEPKTLHNGDYIVDNSMLAFIRGYLVKARLQLSHPKLASNDRIQLGYRFNNSNRGGAYRKITIAFRIDQFYGVGSMSLKEALRKKRQYEEALEFFRTAGYFPVDSTKHYQVCPCLN